MPRLGIDKDFLLDISKMDRPLARKVSDVFGKFAEATHAGIHLERIQNVRDDRLRSIRIDKFWRGIVLAPESGETYTLLKVLGHDEAYAWAQRRQASVNSTTGVIELFDAIGLEEVLPRMERRAEKAAERIFDHVKDGELRKLGIDDGIIPFARSLTNAIQLESAKSFLPAQQWQVLYGLAAGLSPEEVWAEVSATLVDDTVDTDDLDAAVARSRDRVVLVDGPDELMAVLDNPIDIWRIYLHPSQQVLVDADFSGPARATGGPGTGKTVVALHRAYRLAEKTTGKVLVTTFTSTLAASLDAGLMLLADSPGRDPKALGRIDAIHVDKLANQITREQHGYLTILTDQQQDDLWREAIDRHQITFNETFLKEEWRQVVLAQDITSEMAYLKAPRAGRGVPLQRSQRLDIWKAIDTVETALRDRKLWTHETVRREAARILEARDTKPYAHVVIDEAQDLSPTQWRFLRAAVAPASNDIFIVGDTHQRIYNHHVSFRSVGIGIAGRSRRLKINYRTTAEILAWSLGIMHGEDIDDMEGGLDTLTGCRSELHGLPPSTHGFDTQQEELDHLVETVQGWLNGDVTPSEIGIATRSNRYASTITNELRTNGIPVRALADAHDGGDAVAVGTMHRMKGLEFRCVAVAGVGEDHIPAKNAVTPIEVDPHLHQLDLQRERCLLFVACTRAREDLVVAWSGKRCRLLNQFQ
ncbi:3'-5' exonuclease [Lolliginicoccus levis]|uniref:3'-5' exonuclease n=1 Tax=Lolliginicoccus levis TaxID=2919542 RepID=UPI00241D60CD|nr:3'-5' exonuclease [Lolliginicoccus levis]